MSGELLTPEGSETLRVCTLSSRSQTPITGTQATTVVTCQPPSPHGGDMHISPVRPTYDKAVQMGPKSPHLPNEREAPRGQGCVVHKTKRHGRCTQPRPAGARCPACLECELSPGSWGGVGGTHVAEEATSGSYSLPRSNSVLPQDPWLTDEAQCGQATSPGGASLESTWPPACARGPAATSCHGATACGSVEQLGTCPRSHNQGSQPQPRFHVSL